MSLATVAVAALAASCAPDASAPDPSRPWEGDVTTTDAGTRVSNRDGSAWGGSASLSPILAIGLDEGPPEQTFGRIADFELTAEHIWVLETQPPVVRQYNHTGAWIADLGREGEGPGEFQWPSGLAVDEAGGRLLIEHKNPGQLAAVSLAGEPLEPLTVEHWRGANDAAVTPRGLVRTVVLASDKSGADPFARELALEWRSLTDGGVIREPLAVPEGMPPRWVVHCDGGGVIATPVPFAPDFVWAPLHDGGWVTGTSDAYRFEIHAPDGESVTVERYWEPVAVDPEEREWRTRAARGGAKCNSPGSEPDGPEAPRTKRAYETLFDDGSGRIWLVREGPGIARDPCAPIDDSGDWRRQPCWEASRLVDVFGSDGRYLGPLDLPVELQLYPRPIAHGDRVLAVTLDAEGIYRLTWYRLDPPDRSS